MKHILLKLLLTVSMHIVHQSISMAQVEIGDCKINDDLRTEVIEYKNPYRYICHLIVNRTFGTYPSTGFLVSKDVILTAGHTLGEVPKVRIRKLGIIKNKIKSIEILLFEFFEGERTYRYSARLKLYRKDVDAVWTHPEYKGKGEKGIVLDYGYIKLKSDTLYKSTNGYFELARYEDKVVDTTKISITGYPYDMQRIKERSLWTKSDTATNITASSNYLTYSISTKYGDSGAPIWIEEKGHHYVVGIHNTGFTTCNGGTMVNDDVIEKLKVVIPNLNTQEYTDNAVIGSK